jgi:hypothetical protein
MKSENFGFANVPTPRPPKKNYCATIFFAIVLQNPYIAYSI